MRVAADILRLYRIACCGLTAAEQVLADAGLPPMGRAGVRADGPVGRCCDELTVVPVDDAAVTGFDQFGNPDDCITRIVHTFEVHVGRCLSDWFGNDQQCATTVGSCAAVLDCDVSWVPPEKCGASTQADEQALVLADRWALTTGLGAAWKCCLTEGCGTGDCGDVTAFECGAVRFVASRSVCEGGCAGTVLTYAVEML